MVLRSSTYSGSYTSNFGFSAMISRSSSSEPDQAAATALPGCRVLRLPLMTPASTSLARPGAALALPGVRVLAPPVDAPRLHQLGQPGGGHLRVHAQVALTVEGAGADEVHAGLADADLHRRAVRPPLPPHAGDA